MGPLKDKNILVTGGCGSIGAQIVEQLLEKEPSVVRVLDNNEEGLFELQKRLKNPGRTRYLLGDVRDRDRLEMALEGIDIVFHAAALKHVELNEYNPFEAIQTNVNGTQNVIRMSLEEGVESFIAISTDKASNPVSVMGATKLLSERLTIAANTYKGRSQTQFGCVRFGNVLGSSGSVIPIFLEQIQAGGPVTVTDPDMTRFIMPIEEAAELVIEAHHRMTSGEVFVLKMPSLRIGTLAEAMIERFAPEFGYSEAEVETEIIGRRPGERIHEKLVSRDEAAQAMELDDMYVILPQIDVAGYEARNYTDAQPVESEYTSADAELLSKPEIIDTIETDGPIGLFP
jgi:FlaA1/EpsC-like NDP-sugar epimerase